MFRGLLMGAVSVLMVVGLAMANDFPGYGPVQPQNPPDRPQDLYQGDLVAEMGLGCSNPTGNSGGPNDICVGVSCTLAPPFCITAHYYYVYTESPYVTQLDFVCWAGGFEPGAEFARQPGLDWSGGPHTVAISPPVIVNSAFFFLGQNQPQTAAGMRWGLDTNSGSAGTSYIRAPSCGANVFMMVDALGFPGNWCFSATVDAPSPVELQSWGSVKEAYR